MLFSLTPPAQETGPHATKMRFFNAIAATVLVGIQCLHHTAGLPMFGGDIGEVMLSEEEIRSVMQELDFQHSTPSVSSSTHHHYPDQGLEHWGYPTTSNHQYLTAESVGASASRAEHLALPQEHLHFSAGYNNGLEHSTHSGGYSQTLGGLSQNVQWNQLRHQRNVPQLAPPEHYLGTLSGHQDPNFAQELPRFFSASSSVASHTPLDTSNAFAHIQPTQGEPMYGDVGDHYNQIRTSWQTVPAQEQVYPLASQQKFVPTFATSSHVPPSFSVPPSFYIPPSQSVAPTFRVPPSQAVPPSYSRSSSRSVLPPQSASSSYSVPSSESIASSPSVSRSQTELSAGGKARTETVQTPLRFADRFKLLPSHFGYTPDPELIAMVQAKSPELIPAKLRPGEKDIIGDNLKRAWYASLANYGMLKIVSIQKKWYLASFLPRNHFLEDKADALVLWTPTTWNAGNIALIAKALLKPKVGYTDFQELQLGDVPVQTYKRVKKGIEFGVWEKTTPSASSNFS